MNINEFKAGLPFGGARNTLFQVTITNPVNSAGDLRTPFNVTAASLPPLSLGQVKVPYMGRSIPLAGDRVYPPWNVTVINDEDFLIRNAMENWNNAINTFEGNVNAFATDSPNEYKSQAQVFQYNKRNQIIRTYQFNGIWPAEITEIELDWGATDRIQSFQVVFAYDNWSVSGVTGNAGGV